MSSPSLGINHGTYFETYLRGQWTGRGRDVDILGGEEAALAVKKYYMGYVPKVTSQGGLGNSLGTGAAAIGAGNAGPQSLGPAPVMRVR